MDLYASSSILAPRNCDVNKINGMMLNRLPGNVVSTKADLTIKSSGVNSLVLFTELWRKRMMTHTKTGMPDHVLRLNKGCVVMLLRNMDAERGLVNGTRMIVTEICTGGAGKWLKCIILNGEHAGQVVQLPRINFDHTPDEKIPFEFTRKQFPVKICFAMTIMKSQGQTFSGKVGITLPKDVFSHGQLYVALSRCTNLDNLRLCYDTRANHNHTEVRNMVSKNITERLFNV